MKIEKGRIVLGENDKLGELELTKEQRDKLIVDNLALVNLVIRKHFNYATPFDKEDLVGYGVLGLTKAAYSFDVNLGFTFSTYAARKIWGSIKQNIRDNGGIVASREERIKGGMLPPHPFSFYEERVKFNRTDSGDNNTITTDELFYDKITNEGDGDCYSNIIDRMVIDEVLSYLSTRDRKIFRLYFIEDLTQSKVGELVGLSQMQVSRVIKQIKQLFEDLKPLLV